MYEFYFENKPIEAVLNVLMKYQNSDGCFGMLAYDMEFPYSCVKNSENACRYIFALDKVPANHPIIQKLIPY